MVENVRFRVKDLSDGGEGLADIHAAQGGGYLAVQQKLYLPDTTGRAQGIHQALHHALLLRLVLRHQVLIPLGEVQVADARPSVRTVSTAKPVGSRGDRLSLSGPAFRADRITSA